MIDNFLYTDREKSMHVTGSRGCCKKCSEREDLTQTEAEEFHKNGYVIVADAVTDENLQKARKYIDSFYFKWIKVTKRQDDWRCHYFAKISNCDVEEVEDHEILAPLMQSPAIVGRLNCLMGGEPAGIFYTQIAFRTPAPDRNKLDIYAPGAEYHIDGTANVSGTRFPDPWTVMVGVALVDILTKDMGNFTVFPGSHICRDWSYYPEEKKQKALPSLGEPDMICLKAGSAVFVHLLLAHRGGKNVKEPNRETGDLGDRRGVKNILPWTREMLFFRVQREGIDYLAPERAAAILADPWYEHGYFLDRYFSQHGRVEEGLGVPAVAAGPSELRCS